MKLFIQILIVSLFEGSKILTIGKVGRISISSTIAVSDNPTKSVAIINKDKLPGSKMGTIQSN